jgi:hypothetical protein
MRMPIIIITAPAMMIYFPVVGFMKKIPKFKHQEPNKFKK